MKVFPLSSCMFIWTYHVCFVVTKCPSATSMYLYVSTSDPSTQSDISGVMWQLYYEYKIQLVSCEMSPKYLYHFLCWNTYVPYTHIFSVIHFFLYFFPIPYLFLLILRTSFWLVRVPVKFLFTIFRFWKIWNLVILLPTSESNIWLLIVTFSTFIFGVC